ncbi:pentapeptide repeat-containing protein [Modestobacter sp. VKM Ac-2979]|uniref:pentapeptide repeat-containing protein n=1 Tax=Modestobacter sp. VKM Ac-2979 TaxID=3004133 RepID=UPI0022ABA620|nr:pentapeptide repeat-containing protein [Modestobacter sp. VKM Ac-2979]
MLALDEKPRHSLAAGGCFLGRSEPTSSEGAVGVATSRGGRSGGQVSSFFSKHAYEVVRDLGIALLAIAITFHLDARIADRQEAREDLRNAQQQIVENVRFVRERSGDSDGIKPFMIMNLRGANLSGLHLGCSAPSEPSCADLSNADLNGSVLQYTNLRNANLFGADMTNARLWSTDLEGANLINTDLRNAWLADARLQGADLRGADLSGADLSTSPALVDATTIDGVCYDSRTKWPRGFMPPSPECDG